MVWSVFPRPSFLPPLSRLRKVGVKDTNENRLESAAENVQVFN
jgi:hypothetical protein